MPISQISLSSIVVGCQDTISCDLAGEAALLNFKNGIYYGLNLVGASIWKLISEPRSVREICDALVAEYEVEPEICEREVDRIA